MKKSRVEALEHKRTVRKFGAQPIPATSSASGHATAAPASAVPALGFTSIHGRIADYRSVASAVQSNSICHNIMHICQCLFGFTFDVP